MIAEISSQFAGNGLILRGGFAFAPGEDAPGGALAVLLVGHGGPTVWPHFEAWRERQPPDLADPLDAWSREVIGEVAARFGARAVSPSDRPWLPFQQWAMRAEWLKPSPLGILMHPRFGLWHAYRGALLFADEAAADAVRAMNQPDAAQIHHCDLCAGKPCRKSCPVDAHRAEVFAYEACLNHVRSLAGRRCMDGGCLDRNACPVAPEHRYTPPQQAFHMRAFAG